MKSKAEKPKKLTKMEVFKLGSRYKELCDGIKIEEGRVVTLTNCEYSPTRGVEDKGYLELILDIIISTRGIVNFLYKEARNIERKLRYQKVMFARDAHESFQRAHANLCYNFAYETGEFKSRREGARE